MTAVAPLALASKTGPPSRRLEGETERDGTERNETGQPGPTLRERARPGHPRSATKGECRRPDPGRRRSSRTRSTVTGEPARKPGSPRQGQRPDRGRPQTPRSRPGAPGKTNPREVGARRASLTCGTAVRPRPRPRRPDDQPTTRIAATHRTGSHHSATPNVLSTTPVARMPSNDWSRRSGSSDPPERHPAEHSWFQRNRRKALQARTLEAISQGPAGHASCPRANLRGDVHPNVTEQSRWSMSGRVRVIRVG
jgi:hypothetical protein